MSDKEAAALAAREKARKFLEATSTTSHERRVVKDNTLDLVRAAAAAPSKGGVLRAPSDAALPPGFQAVHSAQTIGYAHPNTGCFTLTKPTRSVRDRGHPRHRDAVGLPRGWKLLVCEDCEYYWHVLTGETTRSRPHGSGAA